MSASLTLVNMEANVTTLVLESLNARVLVASLDQDADKVMTVILPVTILITGSCAHSDWLKSFVLSEHMA